MSRLTEWDKGLDEPLSEEFLAGLEADPDRPSALQWLQRLARRVRANQASLRAAEAENRRLREALRPFVAYADSPAVPTAADFDRARAALAETERAGEGEQR